MHAFNISSLSKLERCHVICHCHGRWLWLKGKQQKWQRLVSTSCSFTNLWFDLLLTSLKVVFVLLNGMRFFCLTFWHGWMNSEFVCCVPSKHVATYNSRKMVWVVVATPDFEVARQARPIDMYVCLSRVFQAVSTAVAPWVGNILLNTCYVPVVLVERTTTNHYFSGETYRIMVLSKSLKS